MDSLIYRDLFTLSQSGRVGDVFLLAGDEDLLEGVLAAQDFGVRVNLIGIEPNVSNQAASLRQAADSIYVLQREQLTDVLIRRHSGGRPGTSAIQSGKLRQLEDRFSPSWQDRSTTDADEDAIHSTSERVAAEFFEQASPDEISTLHEQLRSNLDPARRRLPQRADGWLLKASGVELDRWLTESERLLARQVFWTAASTLLEGIDGADEAEDIEGS
ncbi:hypothetical protein [Candidatus Poriferisodalis sp.]|uniref:hypothetical protein n=1 Tax=Candidatus Poriferisodalis sp. TaxID=3101277 RepID=UPI003D11AFED